MIPVHNSENMALTRPKRISKQTEKYTHFCLEVKNRFNGTKKGFLSVLNLLETTPNDMTLNEVSNGKGSRTSSISPEDETTSDIKFNFEGFENDRDFASRSRLQLLWRPYKSKDSPGLNSTGKPTSSKRGSSKMQHISQPKRNAMKNVRLSTPLKPCHVNNRVKSSKYSIMYPMIEKNKSRANSDVGENINDLSRNPKPKTEVESKSIGNGTLKTKKLPKAPPKSKCKRAESIAITSRTKRPTSCARNRSKVCPSKAEKTRSTSSHRNERVVPPSRKRKRAETDNLTDDVPSVASKSRRLTLSVFDYLNDAPVNNITPAISKNGIKPARKGRVNRNGNTCKRRRPKKQPQSKGRSTNLKLKKCRDVINGPHSDVSLNRKKLNGLKKNINSVRKLEDADRNSINLNLLYNNTSVAKLPNDTPNINKNTLPLDRKDDFCKAMKLFLEAGSQMVELFCKTLRQQQEKFNKTSSQFDESCQKVVTNLAKLGDKIELQELENILESFDTEQEDRRVYRDCIESNINFSEQAHKALYKQMAELLKTL